LKKRQILLAQLWQAPAPARNQHRMTPVILELAINGETRKARNPQVPRSPAEIAAEGIACIERGAGLLHNHIEDPFLTGEAAADCYGAGWAAILTRHPDALLCPTMAAGTEHAERISHFDACATVHGARMAPLDPGNMNMPLSGGDVGNAQMLSYINTFDQIAVVLDTLGRLRMGASMGIYEPGFLRAAVAFHKAGRMPPGSIAKLYFFGGRNYYDGSACIGFGLNPSAAALDAYLEIIGDSGLPWAVAVVGGCVFESGMAKLALEKGGHIRLGLEDFAGERTPSNLQLLDEIAGLARAIGRNPASSREAAGLLGL
jgi:3-keto-5-aminohexanoate cleavage enzyme